jgi:hypothetical protein
MYFNDGQGINIEVLFENQNISFPDAPYCAQENKQPKKIMFNFLGS